jgi:hypothetical protein
MNLRTASLTAALLAAAAVTSLPSSADAQWRGRWGWGGFGLGLAGVATGAIIGGALAAPYYAYGYATPYYNYGYAPGYNHGYAPGYSSAYAPGYNYGSASGIYAYAPNWGYRRWYYR